MKYYLITILLLISICGCASKVKVLRDTEGKVYALEANKSGEYSYKNSEEEIKMNTQWEPLKDVFSVKLK